MGSLTLYSHAQELVAWADAIEQAENSDTPAEIMAGVKAKFGEYVLAAAEKVDNFDRFLRHLESLEAEAKAEEIRLRDRREKITALHNKLEQYAVDAMQSAGLRKLDGNLTTFRVRQNPPAVQVEDEAKVPAGYKTATITVNAADWEHHLEIYETLRDMFAEKLVGVQHNKSTFPSKCRVGYSVSKTAIAETLKSGHEVPGTDLRIGSVRLERK